MLLGKIQSGKTKTFLGAIALAFDNGFDAAIILTKGTRALTRQTLARMHRDFARFRDNDQLQIHDIMNIPDGLTGYELSQKIVIIAKKQVDNLERLEVLFRDRYPQLRGKRVLIVDDEVLRRQDRRRFHLEDVLTAPTIAILRDAICNFLVGGVIRRDWMSLRREGD